jgi:hypothetical protein
MDFVEVLPDNGLVKVKEKKDLDLLSCIRGSMRSGVGS